MDGPQPFGDVSTMRLYGGAVGVVSGAYSLWLSGVDTDMVASTSVMALVGLVALVHGLALFTPAAESIGRASGPLMIAYAVVMLLLQGWMELTGPGAGMGMDGMDGAGGMDGAMAAGAESGMVALASLMLFSGVVMTARRGMLAE